MDVVEPPEPADLEHRRGVPRLWGDRPDSSTVLTSTGKNTPNAITAIAVASPTPATTIATGTTAIGGIARRNPSSGSNVRRARADPPSTTPTATASVAPSA